MNRKILRIIGVAGVIGVCTAVMYAPVSLAASDDEKLKIEMTEKMYIGEVSKYCQTVLFGERGMMNWSERNDQAYRSCLREYGVLLSGSAKDYNIGSPGELYDGEPLKPKDMDKAIAEAKAAIEKAGKNGDGHGGYRLTDKGREAVAARLEKEGIENAYGLRRNRRDSKRSAEGEKKSTKKPVYIYKKPQEEDDPATSRVFKGYQ